MTLADYVIPRKQNAVKMIPRNAAKLKDRNPVISAFMQQDGRKKLVCDKSDRAITFEFCLDLHLPHR